MHKRFNILGVYISAVNLDLACQEIENLIRNPRQSYVCVAPVSTIVTCQEDDHYKDVINQADMVTPDGMPLVWLARGLGLKQVRRTYGPDLMLAFFDYSQEKGFRHYLLGGSQETLDKLESNLKQQFPKCNIVGKYSPPFRALTDEEEENIIEKLNTSGADVLWVGLGSPKQEFWIKAHSAKLDVPVAVGVGAAFDFLSGTKPQAPQWMRSLGLEWLFRLCCEPKRLAKRYFLGNSKFIYLIIKSFFKGELKRNAV